jgi:DNA-binding FadR family transcriptional regulator
MKNLLEVIFEFVLAQMVRTTPSPRENQLGRKLHQEIVAAVKARDPNAAEQAMRLHMLAVLDRLKLAAGRTSNSTDRPGRAKRART